MDLVSAELPARTLVVAIDPGKVSNRVVLANGEQGLIGEPVSLSVQRDGDQHERRDLRALTLGEGQGRVAERGRFEPSSDLNGPKRFSRAMRHMRPARCQGALHEQPTMRERR